jgi:hypothetical protein
MVTRVTDPVTQVGSLPYAYGGVRERTDGATHPVRLCDPVLVCSHCGSDRLIPLTFPPPWRAGRFLRQLEADSRPMIKCIRCGERTYVSVKIHRSLSEE